MHPLVRSACIAAGTLVLLAAAQQDWPAAAPHRLAASLAYRGRASMRAEGAPRIAALGDEGLAEYRVALGAGHRYTIHAVCGDGCEDIDLRLYGPDGAQVAADVEDGADPLIDIRSAQPGTYRVRLTMVRCAAVTCNTALGVFSVAN